MTISRSKYMTKKQSNGRINMKIIREVKAGDFVFFEDYGLTEVIEEDGELQFRTKSGRIVTIEEVSDDDY